MSIPSVADTILSQIRAGQDHHGNSGIVLMMCWGANTFVGYERSDADLGSLKFKVQGAKFKGYVHIKLAFDDTYTVAFFNVIDDEVQIHRSLECLHCEDLAPYIDAIVETKGWEYA